MSPEKRHLCRTLLLDSLRHPEPLLRAEGARLLGELREAGPVPALVDLLRNDRWYSKITAVYALGEIGDKRARPVLRALAEDPGVFDFPYMYNHAMIRVAAVLALLKLGDGGGVKRIGDLLSGNRSQAFLELAAPIRALPDNALTQPLKDKVDFALLEHFAGQFQSALHVRVLRALPSFKTSKARAMILGYLGHFSQFVRAAAAEALLGSDPSPAAKARIARLWRAEKAPFARIRMARLLGRSACVSAYLAHPDYFIRATAVAALADIGGPSFSEALPPLLEDAHAYVRLCAVEAVGKRRIPAAATCLEKSLDDGDYRVRLQAAKGLIALAGRPRKNNA